MHAGSSSAQDSATSLELIVDAGFSVRPADAPIRSLALQMVECPVGEVLRPLYLAGKAPELGALVLDRMLGERPVRPPRSMSASRRRTCRRFWA